MEAIRIDEHTWRIEDGFVRCFLLEGTRNALLIDSGATSIHARTIAEGLTKLPVALLNTHADGDHTAGNVKFERFFMHPADYKNCGMAEKFPGCICEPVQDGAVLDLGDRVLEIIYTPGHTYGSIAVLDTTNRCLFPGDSVQDGTIFLFGKHRMPEFFGKSLQVLQDNAERFDKVFPSHGTYELSCEAVGKVAADWDKVQKGELTAEPVDVYGFPAKKYTGSFCGFYCE